MGSQRSSNMEQLARTPRKEQRSILEFLSPLSAEDAEQKAAEQKAAEQKAAVEDDLRRAFIII